jgi:leucyl aminopeptidase
MAYAQLNSIESSLEEIISADAIAVGFVKSEDATYELVGSIEAIATIEKFFDVDLIDEITFFQPAGKAGEILEIPISQKATKADRVFLIGLVIKARNPIDLLQQVLAENYAGRK